MFEFLVNLFDTEGFPPRRHCGEAWTDGHAALHVVSDLAIFGAYFALPIFIAWFMIRRRDVRFPPVLWLFAAFILCCGLGHAIEATIFWHPWYRFSGVMKLLTAVVSWATVFAVIPLVPRALALPRIEARRNELEHEVEAQRASEEELRRSFDELQHFTQSVVGREDRIIELKAEVNALLAELGHDARYRDHEAAGANGGAQ